jgi:hypothetical protein
MSHHENSDIIREIRIEEFWTHFEIRRKGNICIANIMLTKRRKQIAILNAYTFFLTTFETAYTVYSLKCISLSNPI